MRLKPSGSQASPLITNSHLNKSTTNKHWAAGSKLKADIPLLCFPIATSPRKPLFSLYSLTSPLFFFPISSPHAHPSLVSATSLQTSANPGKKPGTPKSAQFQSYQSSMGSASSDVGRVVTNIQTGTTERALATGTELVLCSDATGTIHCRSKRMLK